jgi:uncharacterized membrane protein
MATEEANDEFDRERFEFEKKKWQTERTSRREELDLKRDELNRSRWINPLVIAIFAAAAAGFTNVGVTLIGSQQQSQLEREKATLTLGLEQTKSEAARILEIVKTNDPDKAAANLKFLIDTGLISDPATRSHIQAYLDKRQPGQGVSLPSPQAALFDGSPEFELKVCNLTSVSAFFAVVAKRIGNISYNDEGWWTVPASQCTNIGNFSKSSTLYWTANSGEKTWGLGTTFCFPSEKVNRPHGAGSECSNGERLMKFSELHGPEYPTYTLNLTMDLNP